MTIMLGAKKILEAASGLQDFFEFVDRERLVGQRIRPQLELHGLAGCALAAFEVPRSARGIRGPESLALPAGFRIIDAAVQALGEEAHRVGNSHHQELSGLGIERFESVHLVAGGDRSILAEAERVELVDPVVVVGVHAAVFRRALEARTGRAIERPTFWAVLAGGGRAVQRALALAAVKAGEVAAGENGPDDSVTGDVHTAR